MSMPSAGQFVVLHVSEGIFKGHYHAQIREIKKQWLLIDIPVNTETQIFEPLPEGTKVTVHFSDAKDTPCEFDSIIEANLFKDVHLQVIRKPEKEAIRRKQRREYVRVPASISVELVLMDLETRKIHTIPSITRDISGGGLSLIIRRDSPVKTGDLAGFRFRLNVDGKIHEIIGKTRVLKVSKASDPSARNTCSLKFVEISETNRQTIIQYVYRRQIELRERGWLRSK
ncbi:flagellar brake protein [Effusibacillus consociatus]|uniref:Flagellar brake protein n=1 Tax=Effusibacillus consociatus TaxID=1117041 RepID=A0ABV9Q4V2_9BACL